MLFAVQQGPLAPGPRYRVFQYLPHLKRAAIVPTVLEMQGRDPPGARLAVRGPAPWHACFTPADS